MSGDLGSYTTSVAPALKDELKPLAWLLGKWKTTSGVALYPTTKTSNYGEQIEFFHVGQPIIQFTLCSFNAMSGAPMHREAGFIRINTPTNEVAYASAHSMGLVEMEEGHVTDEELNLQTVSVGRMSFGKSPAVTELKRRWRKLDGDRLEQVVEMATANTPLTEHLRATYERVA